MTANRTLVLRSLLAVILLATLAAGISTWQWLSPYHKAAREIDITVLQRPLAHHTWTSLEVVPWHVVQAILAAEDTKFFEHCGIDPLSALTERSGPTITLQLARQLMPRREYSTVWVEPFLAMRIESAYTKSEILEAYLNRIYLGQGHYGIGDASRAYFGKAPRDLTVLEGATLAAIPDSPNTLTAPGSASQLETSRNAVLAQMASERMITASEASGLQATPLAITLSP